MSEDVFEAAHQNASYQAGSYFYRIAEQLMLLEFAQVSHIDSVGMEGLRKALGISEIIAAGFRFEGIGQPGKNVLFQVGSNRLQSLFLLSSLGILHKFDRGFEVGIDEIVGLYLLLVDVLLD